MGWSLKNIQDRDWQYSLADEFANNPDQNYVIWSPTGMGKTVLTYLGLSRAKNIGRMDGKKAVIVPHSRFMEGQWYEYAKHFGLSKSASVVKNDKMMSYTSRTGSPWKNQRIKVNEWRREKLKDGDIIISTPGVLSNDLQNNVYDKKMVDKTEMVIFDEAGNILRLNPKEPVYYDARESYKPILDAFKSQQKIGLTGTPGRDKIETQALCETLGDAKMIGPSNEDIEKYAPRVERRLYYITDDWVKGVDKLIKREIAKSFQNINYSDINLDESNPQSLLRFLYSRINDPDEKISTAAKSFIRNTHARLLLYEHSFDKLYNYVMSKEGWEDMKELLEERAKTEPYSPKTKKFTELVETSLDNDEKIIVFDRFIDGCKELKKALGKKGINSLLATGEMSGEIQRRQIMGFKRGEEDILIATSGIGGTGVDLPNADTVIQYGISSSPAQMEQRSGRIRGGIEKNLVYKQTQEDEKFNRFLDALDSIEKNVEKIKGDPEVSRKFKEFLKETS